MVRHHEQTHTHACMNTHTHTLTFYSHPFSLSFSLITCKGPLGVEVLQRGEWWQPYVLSSPLACSLGTGAVSHHYTPRQPEVSPGTSKRTPPLCNLVIIFSGRAFSTALSLITITYRETLSDKEETPCSTLMSGAPASLVRDCNLKYEKKIGSFNILLLTPEAKAMLSKEKTSYCKMGIYFLITLLLF